MRATPAVLVACTTLLALAACAEEKRTPRTVAGSWVQVELNGKRLPARFETEHQGQVCVNEMVHNAIQLNADGGYTSTGEVRSGCGPASGTVPLRTVPFSDEGIFTLQGPMGDTIVLEPQALQRLGPSARPVVQGVFRGNELVITLTDPVSGETQTARHVKD